MTPRPTPYGRWTRDGSGLTGTGGVVLALDGDARLARLAALWADLAPAVRVVPVGRAQRAVCLVSSVFDDASPQPALLHVPGDVVELSDGAEVGRRTQDVAPAALAELAGRHGARLVTDAEIAAWSGGDGRPAGGPCAADDGGALTGHRARIVRALDEIGAGRARKVVVARDVLEPLAGAGPTSLTDTLAAAYPGTWAFAVGGLVGATPELLALRRGDRFASRVLAGSQRRLDDPDADAASAARLRTDRRLVEEHTLAATPVVEALAAHGTLDDPSPEPAILTLPNVHHLSTDVVGTLADPATDVLALVASIHPTAAVAGVPTRVAMDVIRRVEATDRGRYAGPVGWMDAAGDGEIGLALRCGQIEGGNIRLFAGGGIVAGADPDDEVAETVGKLRPMREALGGAGDRHGVSR